MATIVTFVTKANPHWVFILDGMTAISLFIIEAHDAVRLALKRRLERVDQFQVVGEAATVVEALRWLGDAQADVVLLGVSSLKPSNNAAALQHIRQITNAPLIVLMAYLDEVEVTALQDTANTHYLLKHVNTPHLIHVIESSIRIAALNDASSAKKKTTSPDAALNRPKFAFT